MPKPTRKSLQSDDVASYQRRHTALGWWSLLIFVTLGIVLEALHGFKVSWYVSAGDETRRLLWRLAHAHGSFLSLVHLAFSATLRSPDGAVLRARRVISPCLVGAGVAVPGGFFLGGSSTYDGDPGLGIVLLPLGAVMLWLAILLTALGRREQHHE